MSRRCDALEIMVLVVKFLERFGTYPRNICCEINEDNEFIINKKVVK